MPGVVVPSGRVMVTLSPAFTSLCWETSSGTSPRAGPTSLSAPARRPGRPGSRSPGRPAGPPARTPPSPAAASPTGTRPADATQLPDPGRGRPGEVVPAQCGDPRAVGVPQGHQVVVELGHVRAGHAPRPGPASPAPCRTAAPPGSRYRSGTAAGPAGSPARSGQPGQRARHPARAPRRSRHTPASRSRRGCRDVAPGHRRWPAGRPLPPGPGGAGRRNAPARQAAAPAATTTTMRQRPPQRRRPRSAPPVAAAGAPPPLPSSAAASQ